MPALITLSDDVGKSKFRIIIMIIQTHQNLPFYVLLLSCRVTKHNN